MCYIYKKYDWWAAHNSLKEGYFVYFRPKLYEMVRAHIFKHNSAIIRNKFGVEQGGEHLDLQLFWSVSVIIAYHSPLGCGVLGTFSPKHLDNIPHPCSFVIMVGPYFKVWGGGGRVCNIKLERGTCVEDETLILQYVPLGRLYSCC